MTSSASSSRFHIIKIDTGPYKRGRWNCRDFDEACTMAPASAVRSDMISLGGHRSGSSNCSSGRTSYHYVAEDGERQGTDGQGTPVALLAAATAVTPEQQNQDLPIADIRQRVDTSFINGLPATSAQQPPATVSLNSSSTLNCTPSTASQKQIIAAPAIVVSAQPPQRPHANKISQDPSVDLGNEAAAILDSIIVESMQLDKDQLQNDQIVTSSSNRENGDASLDASNLHSTEASTSISVQNPALASAGANVVAIDNKIEQAMDLVKTHLLYAVREEVDVLKEKIIDLEKKVFRLETENKLLREYAPPEIILQIQQQSVAGQTALSLSNPPLQQQQSNLLPSSQQLQPNAISSVAVPSSVQQQPESMKPAIGSNLSTGATTNNNNSPSVNQNHTATPPS